MSTFGGSAGVAAIVARRAARVQSAHISSGTFEEKGGERVCCVRGCSYVCGKRACGCVAGTSRGVGRGTLSDCGMVAGCIIGQACTCECAVFAMDWTPMPSHPNSRVRKRPSKKTHTQSFSMHPLTCVVAGAAAHEFAESGCLQQSWHKTSQSTHYQKEKGTQDSGDGVCVCVCVA